jgi:hypothetical protein
MHIMHTSHVIALSCAGCLTIQGAALALLFLGPKHLRLSSVGGALLAFGSKAMLALPGVVLVGLLVENMNLLPLQPYLYAVGATSSCVLLDLCLHLE